MIKPKQKPTDPTRSRIMKAVKSKDTKPEMAVRHLVHSMGYRYRLHKRDLPGCPDLVFPAKKKIIFINGCFWHGHNCPRGGRKPVSNAEYWTKKIQGNKQRDLKNYRILESLGWKTLIVWECKIKNKIQLQEVLGGFLKDD